MMCERVCVCVCCVCVCVCVCVYRLLRDTADNLRDTYEGVDTCPMRDPQGLVLYIRERRGQSSNGTVVFPAFNAMESQEEILKKKNTICNSFM
jgi:hypothetical protein